jgi:cytoplasmic iron level regulating protein YaaA (DUF328/UPF0246 family)
VAEVMREKQVANLYGVTVALDILKKQMKDTKQSIYNKGGKVHTKWKDAVVKELMQLTSSGKQP